MTNEPQNITLKMRKKTEIISKNQSAVDLYEKGYLLQKVVLDRSLGKHSKSPRGSQQRFRRRNIKSSIEGKNKDLVFV